MKKYFFVSFVFILNGYSQQFDKAIEDNSIMIEEAYNQEERVVQHIFSLERISETDTPFDFSFTQEWPIGGRMHQLSYSIPISFTKNNGNTPGDIWLNYRYQLIDDETFAVCPRASFILPTGKVNTGNGNNKVGFEFNIPTSKRFTNNFVMHYNAGYNIIPNAEHFGSSGSFSKTINDFFIGASGIWLATYNFNLLLELLFENHSSREKDNSSRINTTVINPAIRFAIDTGSLQIVPILSAPTYFDEEKTTTNILFYISFEHNF